MRTNAAPGSAVIFDHLCESTTAVPTGRNRLGALLSRVTGERRQFGIEGERIEDFLTRRGFTRVVNADAEQLKRLYCTGPNQNRMVTEDYAIVHGEVVGGPAPRSTLCSTRGT